MVDFSWNEFADPKFKYTDEKLLEAVQARDPSVDMFFKVLSLCHTVMSEQEEGKLVYQAQSPDEEALLTAARNFGYVYLVSLFSESVLSESLPSDSLLSLQNQY